MITVQGDRVLFSFFRPHAQQVHVVGDFNGWREGATPMRHAADGYWQATLVLPPGSYKFRYCADGRWYTDYAAFGVEHGPFGLDSVVYMAAQPVSLSRHAGAASAGRAAV